MGVMASFRNVLTSFCSPHSSGAKTGGLEARGFSPWVVAGFYRACLLQVIGLRVGCFPPMLTDFVGDWRISHTLGEGAYGEVKLLVNRRTGDCVAMKLIDMSCSEAAKTAVKKEVKIHKVLRNKHVIRFLGTRTQSNHQFIFLEYASNGELFDRIEPDIGMHHGEAQKFMKQLMSGVEYLHSLGITHRDIKPENLLIDQNDNLKISDFGLATIFRYNGQERLLERQCGTEPYAAPEVLARRYAAVPADLWSCGVVLVAMLAGELPWDKAMEDKLEYSAWLRGEYMSLSPWTKLDTQALSLLKLILHPIPSHRPSIHQISAHRWLKKKFPSPTPLRPSNGEVKVSREDRSDSGLWMSQRERSRPGSLVEEAPTSFSQPVTSLDDILLSTQEITATQSQGQDCLQKLVRRLTRFSVELSREEAVSCLTDALTTLRLESTLGDSIVTVHGVDKRKSPLTFKATLFHVSNEDDTNQTLIDFRLSKGDGLEFKRHYIAIRSALSPHIVKKRS